MVFENKKTIRKAAQMRGGLLSVNTRSDPEIQDEAKRKENTASLLRLHRTELVDKRQQENPVWHF